MEPREEPLVVDECPRCGSVRVSDGASSSEEDETRSVPTDHYSSPTVESVFREVFGIAGPKPAICRAVMVEDETTAEALARRLDRNRSSINRHLNHLVSLGVLNKEPQTLPEGGRVFVYTHIPMDDLQHRFRLGLYGWFAEAVALVEELDREKLEAMVEADDGEKTTDPSDGEPGPDTEAVARDGSDPATDEVEGGSLVRRLLGSDRFS